MTVAELIEQLKAFDPQHLVKLWDPDTDAYMEPRLSVEGPYGERGADGVVHILGSYATEEGYDYDRMRTR